MDFREPSLRESCGKARTGALVADVEEERQRARRQELRQRESVIGQMYEVRDREDSSVWQILEYICTCSL